MKQQNWISVRFLIGLSCETDPSNYDRPPYFSEKIRERAATARRILAHSFAFGGAYCGRGLWNGKEEPCMMFETIGPDGSDVESHARGVARDLARALDQESIGLVFTPVKFETVGQDSPQ